jgi:hypothetical protein
MFHLRGNAPVWFFLVCFIWAGLSGATACTELTPPQDTASRVPSQTGAGIWQGRFPLPSPRSEVAVTALEEKAYVIGGFTPEGGITKSVGVYDPASTPGNGERTFL